MLAARYRLRKDYQYRYVFNHGSSVGSRSVILFYSPTKPAHVLRVGFQVSNKIGKAVYRNRVKRLIREAVRLKLPLVKRGYNLVFAANSKYDFSKFSLAETENTVSYLLGKAGLI